MHLSNAEIAGRGVEGYRSAATRSAVLDLPGPAGSSGRCALDELNADVATLLTDNAACGR